MKKYLFLIGLFLIGCSSNDKYLANEGEVNIEYLFNSPNTKWFKANYESYVLDDATLDSGFSKIFNYEIEIYMNTKCHDSKREIPRLIKILDNLKFSESKMDIIALTKDKKGYFKDYSKYKVLNTPTIIFYLDNNEIGRIIEKPKDSLEAAISLIIKDE